MLESTFTSYSKESKEIFDLKELIAMLEKVGEPQGLVLLPYCHNHPSGTGLSVYQFPADLLKTAISHIKNPFRVETIKLDLKTELLKLAESMLQTAQYARGNTREHTVACCDVERWASMLQGIIFNSEKISEEIKNQPTPFIINSDADLEKAIKEGKIVTVINIGATKASIIAISPDVSFSESYYSTILDKYTNLPFKY